MSDSFYAPLAALAARGTPTMVGYGVDDDFYADFSAARAGARLPRLLDAPGSRIEVRTLPGSIHGLRRLGAQESVVQVIEEWVSLLGAEQATTLARAK